MGRGDRKFSKMVELQGSQNLKMVELLGVKFVQEGLFLKTSLIIHFQKGPFQNYRGALNNFEV